jgi:DNA-binding NtrC family response regulator
LAPALRAKLLRALPERAFERIGSAQNIAANVRIAANYRDVLADANARCFREELACRLDGARIRILALRGREEDIPILKAARACRPFEDLVHQHQRALKR